jgi:Sortase domain
MQAMSRRRWRGGAWLNLAAVTLISTGIVIAVTGHDTLRWSPPPLPPAWAAGHPGEPPRHLADDSGSRTAAYRLARSEPARIGIPAIRVRARVAPLGEAHDGSIAVPSLKTPFVTGWFDRGPTPGSPGASVILGHVDAEGVGPAIFYNLGKVRPGDRIYIRLHSGRTAIFEAYSIALYQKTRFPTAAVYGYTNWPTLRLVTCGGEFDPRTGHYLGNIVVFASYIGHRG